MADKQVSPSRSGQPTAPAEYPSQPCFSDLLYLGTHEVRNNYSEESRHTTGSSGYDFAWKPGYPKVVYLPAEYYGEGRAE
jgi:hypothetical protein